MKKLLVASTALLSAALISHSAMAAEKIKLDLSGFSTWMVVGAWNDDEIAGDFNSVDVKGDVEVHFTGETTLDNGLTVGVVVELEAGGNVETRGGDDADVIDESYIYISGNFGQVTLGTSGSPAALMHVSAPDASGTVGYQGLLTDGGALAIPADFLYNYGTALDSDGEAERVSYVTPSLAGLSLGASYAPNWAKDTRGPVDLSNADENGETYSLAALYEGEFGDVGVMVSAAWNTFALGNGDDNRVNEYAIGANVEFAGITAGGSYRNQNPETGAEHSGFDGSAWDLGVQYATGPYAVSLYYLNSRQDSGAGTDKMDVYQASASYALGAGVDVIGAIGYGKYSDANNVDNKGFMAMTGLALAF